ncbi:hypothetical protein M407DRAFT_243604 [Tulasnella calospora MUT 4182]|uniref:Mediator of RNA polymerase II transcription subunit 9 n=1 Tax=Tulasnella calospora MUT 4182 TaxID=1051891 RepID=A0A0C3KZH2_9AGAM|nr:hypothetical protein M407DRAFT_243604 [Tulasnella calospora MUT 4182]
MTIFQPPQNSLPISAFESLQPALIKVLKAVHDAGDSDEVQHRLAIATATNELKERIVEAKTLIDALPGGEMLIEHQDEVIKALEQLKAQKTEHLIKFTSLGTAKSELTAGSTPMQQDSAT